MGQFLTPHSKGHFCTSTFYKRCQVISLIWRYKCAWQELLRWHAIHNNRRSCRLNTALLSDQRTRCEIGLTLLICRSCHTFARLTLLWSCSSLGSPEMLRGSRWLYISDVSGLCIRPIFKVYAVQNASLFHGSHILSRNFGKSYQPTPRNIRKKATATSCISTQLYQWTH
jgi:hypothetical protein